MIVLGLTGSIGMGKSTTAGIFAALGVPVHSADAEVHRLYDGPLAAEIEAAFPGTVVEGRVDRERLAASLKSDAAAFRRLEAVVHPRVREAEAAFLERARSQGALLAVLDIPLLFETGAQSRVDKVLVVTASPEIQRERVLARPGMTEEKFAAILSQQMPDADKRRRADFVFDTSNGLASARSLAQSLLRALARS